jgi:hypothetical protein
MKVGFWQEFARHEAAYKATIKKDSEIDPAVKAETEKFLKEIDAKLARKAARIAAAKK